MFEIRNSVVEQAAFHAPRTLQPVSSALILSSGQVVAGPSFNYQSDGWYMTDWIEVRGDAIHSIVVMGPDKVTLVIDSSVEFEPGESWQKIRLRSRWEAPKTGWVVELDAASGQVAQQERILYSVETARVVGKSRETDHFFGSVEATANGLITPEWRPWATGMREVRLFGPDSMVLATFRYMINVSRPLRWLFASGVDGVWTLRVVEEGEKG